MTKKQVEKEAASLQAKLGKGWRVRVFENLGWHFTAYYKDGCLSLHDHYGLYFCMFTYDPKYRGCGDIGGWYSEQSFRDPLKAIQATRAIIRRKLESITKSATQALGGKL